MATPRKFSEKIALHNQKQAEETAAFEAIIKEVNSATRVTVSGSRVVACRGRGRRDLVMTVLSRGRLLSPSRRCFAASLCTSPFQQPQFQKQHLPISQTLGAYRGGSLPNVNQIGNPSIDLQVNVILP